MGGQVSCKPVPKDVRPDWHREPRSPGCRAECLADGPGLEATTRSGKEKWPAVAGSGSRTEVADVGPKNRPEPVVDRDDAPATVLGRLDEEAILLKVGIVKDAGIADAESGPGEERYQDPEARRRGVDEGQELSVTGYKDKPVVDTWKGELRQSVVREEVLGEQPSGEGSEGSEVAADGAQGQGGGVVLEIADFVPREVIDGRTSVADGESGDGRLVVADSGWPQSTAPTIGEVTVEGVLKWQGRLEHGEDLRRYPIREVSTPENSGQSLRNERASGHGRKSSGGLDSVVLSVDWSVWGPM